MSDLTSAITDMGIDNIRAQIKLKKGNMPYHATAASARGVTTDYDTFPYPRWYRGVPQSHQPIVAEREAGWRARRDACYSVQQPPTRGDDPYPNHCFSGATNVTYPCYPEYQARWGDKDSVSGLLNKSCIIQYR